MGYLMVDKIGIEEVPSSATGSSNNQPHEL